MTNADVKDIIELANIIAERPCDSEDCAPCIRMGRRCNDYLKAERAIKAGYRKQNKWISVEERLPSSEDLERSQFHNFLVANEFGEVREAVFTGKYFAKLGSRLSGVTHWMPLPESPVMKGV